MLKTLCSNAKNYRAHWDREGTSLPCSQGRQDKMNHYNITQYDVSQEVQNAVKQDIDTTFSCEIQEILAKNKIKDQKNKFIENKVEKNVIPGR